MIAKQHGGDEDYFMSTTGYSLGLAGLMRDVVPIEEIYKSKINPPVHFDCDGIQEAVVILVLACAIEKAGTLDTE